MSFKRIVITGLMVTRHVIKYTLFSPFKCIPHTKRREENWLLILIDEGDRLLRVNSVMWRSRGLPEVELSRDCSSTVWERSTDFGAIFSEGVRSTITSGFLEGGRLERPFCLAKRLCSEISPCLFMILIHLMNDKCGH